MGIDLLDLMFRIDKEFNVRLPRDWMSLSPIMQTFVSGASIKGPPRDMSVGHFVLLIELQIANQNPVENHHVFERVRPLIAECLAVEESLVVPEAWLYRDLGMD